MKKILFYFIFCFFFSYLLLANKGGYEYKPYKNYDSLAQENINLMQGEMSKNKYFEFEFKMQKDGEKTKERMGEIEAEDEQTATTDVVDASSTQPVQTKKIRMQDVSSLNNIFDQPNRKSALQKIKPETLQGNENSEKLFNQILAAYQSKNRLKFNQSKNIFQAAFPHSEYNHLLEAYVATFYLYEKLISQTNNTHSIIEIDLPPFQSLEEMFEYFREIKDIGIESIIINPFQLDNNKVFLFAKNLNHGGAYYRSQYLNFHDDILQKILSMTLQLGIKVYIKLPVRTHPWLAVDKNSILMEQFWSFTTKKNSYQPKLSLIHPYAMKYMKNIIDELLNYNINGIIIKDDYTYSILEGNSSLVTNIYQREKNIAFQIQKYTTLYNTTTPATDFDFLKEKKYNAQRLFLHWKASKIHLFLNEMIEYIQGYRKEIKTGIEISPILFSNYFKSLYLFNQNGRQIINLPVDFFYFNWQHSQEPPLQTDTSQYKEIYDTINENKLDSQEVWLKYQLKPRIHNSLPHLQSGQKLIYELGINDEFNLVFGPINRNKSLNFTIDRHIN